MLPVPVNSVVYGVEAWFSLIFLYLFAMIVIRAYVIHAHQGGFLNVHHENVLCSTWTSFVSFTCCSRDRDNRTGMHICRPPCLWSRVAIMRSLLRRKCKILLGIVILLENYYLTCFHTFLFSFHELLYYGEVFIWWLHEHHFAPSKFDRCYTLHRWKILFCMPRIGWRTKVVFFYYSFVFLREGFVDTHRNITYLVFPPNSLLVDYAVA